MADIFTPESRFLTIEKFDRRMRELAENGSQLIIATHSPILLAYPDCWIYEFSDDGIRRVDYEDTDLYRITKDFLNHYPQVLEDLFRE